MSPSCHSGMSISCIKDARAHKVCYTTIEAMAWHAPSSFTDISDQQIKMYFFVKFLSLQFTIFSSLTYLSCHFSLAEYVLYVKFGTNVSQSMVVVTYDFVKYYSKYKCQVVQYVIIYIYLYTIYIFYFLF